MGEIFVYRSFPSVMTFFMFGSLSYYVGRIIINSLKNNYYIFGFNLILPITLFFLIFPHTLDNFIPEQHKAKFFMIILFIFIPAFFQKTRYSNIDNMIGKLSYPLFIVHPFILFLIEDFYDSLYFPFSALFISSLASLIMVVFIENPINKWKKNKILI